MCKTVFGLLLMLSLVVLGSCRWEAGSHQYYPATSAQVADAIRVKLLSNINKFVDRQFAQDLEADLTQKDDSKRSLKEISSVSANQMFGILGLSDPECDANEDGTIKGDELKCLNYAWKAYLPH